MLDRLTQSPVSNNFRSVVMKRNTLTTAVLAGLTGIAGMASVANAVNVNPDGLGQVLLFPYYTARGGNDTLISIVNTTERGKAVKIRFIEALNSREVLDFNLYLSPYDIWTAVVTADGDGAKMLTSDTSCTVPYFVGNSTDGVGSQEFLTFEFTGPKADGGPTGRERTASGYIEVIEMGTMLPQQAPTQAAPLPAGLIEWATKHVNGVPRNCGIPVSAWTQGSGLPWISGNTDFGFRTNAAGAVVEVDGRPAPGATGGLFGSATIINVANGTLLSYNATAVDGFWDTLTTAHTRPDSLEPNLSGGDVFQSFVFNNGALVNPTWGAGLFALNATLTLDRLFNEYVTTSTLGARTEWVLTFPTKRFHTDVAIGGVSPNNPIPPFTRTWHRVFNNAGAVVGLNLPCEDMEYRFWDREEREPETTFGPPIVSPPPPPTAIPQFQLCRESNVIRFSSNGALPDSTEILAEPMRTGGPGGAWERLGYTNFNLPYSEGWVRFDLATVPSDSPICAGPAAICTRESLASVGGTKVQGLPVIGFQATTFTNGTLAGGVLSNYGGTFNHRGSRSFGS